MKKTIKLLAFLMICTIMLALLASCAEKRILVIDEGKSAATSGASSSRDSDNREIEDLSDTLEDYNNYNNGDETMPDDIYASPIEDTTDVGEYIAAEVFECVCVDGLNIQYIKNDPSVGYTYMIVSSFQPHMPFAPAPSATDVIIPETVDNIGPVIAIGDGAFEGFDIESITIPECVKTVENAAFNNCNALSKVYYQGTAAEWALVEIESNNAPLLTATCYYYSETEPAASGNFWHYVGGVPTVW